MERLCSMEGPELEMEGPVAGFSDSLDERLA